ncbi:DUF2891 domain-containing protein [Craurococcus roseus]|uniref:DUF2891 domain-containing protein n=1 Tax=Craurococcus roseus TaxID=77585 RepID=A0ABN1ET25_9PROT
MDDSRLSPELAGRFAAIALGHVRREYPNRLEQTLSGPGDLRPPSELHPVFHGSYDWHSCVHSYWMLARLLRRFPDSPEAPAIRALFDAQLVPAKVEAERAYLAAPAARGFKRPYGWAWLLKLSEELGRHGERRWAAAVEPLAEVFAGRFRDFLPIATYAVRVGTHFNTAFGLRMAVDYAEAAGDAALSVLLRGTAERWYGADADCPAWGEPGGDDFLSSALVEAECMRRLLPPERFLPWFGRFLPRLAEGEPAPLFRPAVVADRGDGKIAHLDGLNLSRAWCWRSLAAALPPGDPRRARTEEAARGHLAASLPHIADDYMGEHWLATFAVLALEAERA